MGLGFSCRFHQAVCEQVFYFPSHARSRRIIHTPRRQNSVKTLYENSSRPWDHSANTRICEHGYPSRFRLTNRNHCCTIKSELPRRGNTLYVAGLPALDRKSQHQRLMQTQP